MPGGVGVGAHGAVELRHRGGSLLQVAGLLLGAVRQVLVALGDLGRSGGDAVATVAPTLHQLNQVLGHGLEGVQQQAGFVHPRLRVLVDELVQPWHVFLRQVRDGLGLLARHGQRDDVLGDGRVTVLQLMGLGQHGFEIARMLTPPRSWVTWLASRRSVPAIKLRSNCWCFNPQCRIWA
jgi:hypothetical protein